MRVYTKTKLEFDDISAFFERYMHRKEGKEQKRQAELYCIVLIMSCQHTVVKLKKEMSPPVTHFVIVGVSVAWYPALSPPQAALRKWRVEDGYRDILHPLLLPRLWVGSVLDAQRSPMDRCGIFLLDGLHVVFGESGVDALLQFQRIPNFGGVFMQRHDGLLESNLENKRMMKHCYSWKSVVVKYIEL